LSKKQDARAKERVVFMWERANQQNVSRQKKRKKNLPEAAANRRAATVPEPCFGKTQEGRMEKRGRSSKDTWAPPEEADHLNEKVNFTLP